MIDDIGPTMTIAALDDNGLLAMTNIRKYEMLSNRNDEVAGSLKAKKQMRRPQLTDGGGAPPRKHVRFNCHATQIHYYQYYHFKDGGTTNEQVQTLQNVDGTFEQQLLLRQQWYSAEDFHKFKKQAKQLALTVLSMEDDKECNGLAVSLHWYHNVMVRLLHNIYQTEIPFAEDCGMDESGVTNASSSSPASCRSPFVMDPGLRFDLFALGERAPDLIGMEKYAVPTLARDGARRRIDVVHQVLSLQKEYNNLSRDDFFYGCHSRSTGGLPPQRDEALRQVSALLSGPGRCMAWAVAQHGLFH